MGRKLTFEGIYRHFRKQFPKTAKQVFHWRVKDQMQIWLYFKDGTLGYYSYLLEQVYFDQGRWEPERKPQPVNPVGRPMTDLKWGDYSGSNYVVAENIRSLMKESGLNSTELAERTRMSKTTISHYTSGRRIPSEMNAKKLADALGVTVDELYGRLA